jgi:acyl transferase domain-containing protein
MQGTQAEDNAEISSISQVFCGPDRDNDIDIGSIKSNIGHLEASSGVAGLIKSIMVLKKGLIPPIVDFIKPKESLRLDERKIMVWSLFRLPIETFF